MQKKEQVERQLWIFYRSYFKGDIAPDRKLLKVKCFFCFVHTAFLGLAAQKGQWKTDNDFTRCITQYKRQRHFCTIYTFMHMLSVKPLTRLLIQYTLNAVNESINKWIHSQTLHFVWRYNHTASWMREKSTPSDHSDWNIFQKIWL